MTRTNTILFSLHAVGVLFFLTLFYLSPSPLHTDLVRWDAVWYESVQARGYFFRPVGYSSVAFFPFFPLVWYCTHLGSLGVSILNLVISAGTLYGLYRYLHLRPLVVLLFTALPSSLFFYLPYTEALFFLFSSLVLLGLAQCYKSPAGLAGASYLGALTRVTALFYLPAFVVVEGLALWQRPGPSWRRAWHLGLYGAAIGLGLASVVVYQWCVTGVWFAFNKAEAQWNHHLAVPQLPFTSNGNDSVLLLDGLALLVGVVAGIWALGAIAQVLRRQRPTPNPVVLFSAVFLATTVFNTVIVAPITLTNQSSLMSLHRYVFSTPFFLILLNEFLPRQRPAPRTVLLVLGGVLLLTAVLGMLGTRAFELDVLRLVVPGFLYAGVILAYSALWLLASRKWGWLTLYFSSLALQLFYLYTYTTGNWVG